MAKYYVTYQLRCKSGEKTQQSNVKQAKCPTKSTVDDSTENDFCKHDYVNKL